MTTNDGGAETARQTYYPFGAVRTTSGTLPTDYTFTGQKLDASARLMYYGARYYAAEIGRFAQPDSIVPDMYNPQSLNRYSYTLNNPVRYTDPTGHYECAGDTGDDCEDAKPEEIIQELEVEFDVEVSSDFSEDNVRTIRDTLFNFANAVGGLRSAKHILRGAIIQINTNPGYRATHEDGKYINISPAT